MFGLKKAPVDPILDTPVSIGAMPSTTLRTCRMHAVGIAETDARNSVEEGLAVTVVYLIDRLQKEAQL